MDIYLYTYILKSHICTAREVALYNKVPYWFKDISLIKYSESKIESLVVLAWPEDLNKEAKLNMGTVRK